jgi:hypothetical protein
MRVLCAQNHTQLGGGRTKKGEEPKGRYGAYLQAFQAMYRVALFHDDTRAARTKRLDQWAAELGPAWYTSSAGRVVQKGKKRKHAEMMAQAGQ